MGVTQEIRLCLSSAGHLLQLHTKAMALKTGNKIVSLSAVLF